MWQSPDGRIKKLSLVSGHFGVKPDFNSVCKIIVKECYPDVEYFNCFTKLTEVVIGDNDGDFGRILDICLMTMHEKETAKFNISLDCDFSIVIYLEELIFKGFIYEWKAREIYDLALYHKNKGVELFKDIKTNREAAFRFTKALKLILLIPLDVQEPPTEVDGLPVTEINQLKCNLYNNLSSCYFRKGCWPMVIDICKKVFQFDNGNVKALYKIGVAYKNDRNFELAEQALNKVLEIEPHNKAAVENLIFVKKELKQAEARCNNIVKKMFKA